MRCEEMRKRKKEREERKKRRICKRERVKEIE
jgi:hypothetical protein